MEILTLVENWFQVYGWFIIIGVLIAEKIPGINALAPATSLLVFIGFFYAHNYPNLFLALLLCIFSLWVGDYIWFWVGKKTKHRSSKYIENKPKIQKVLTIINQQPTSGLLFYQFPPYLRMVTPFIMGSTHYPDKKWLIYSFLASVLYVSAYLIIGIFIQTSLRTMNNGGSWLEIISIFFALIGVIYLVYLYRKTGKI